MAKPHTHSLENRANHASIQIIILMLMELSEFSIIMSPSLSFDWNQPFKLHRLQHMKTNIKPKWTIKQPNCQFQQVTNDLRSLYSKTLIVEKIKKVKKKMTWKIITQCQYLHECILLDHNSRTEYQQMGLLKSDQQ